MSKRTPAALFVCLWTLIVATAGPARGASVAARTLDAAQAAAEAGDAGEAARLYAALAEENPANGAFWYAAATAYYQMKEWRKSADCYAKAAELGYEKGAALYNMACDLSLLGETEAAVAAIERAIPAGLQNRERLLREDSDLDAIRDTPLFRERILPSVPEGISREAGWRLDLDYLNKRMEETHYDLYANISREEWRSELDRLSRDLPALAEHEIIVRLMALFARIGDGHTNVMPRMEGRPADYTGPYWHIIPAEFYAFSDGVYVRSASGKYREAVGKRVVRVGKLPVEEALAKCATVTQRDNAQQIKWLAPLYLSAVEILDALDVSDGLDGVDVVVAGRSGKERTIHFEAVPFTRDAFARKWEDKVSMADGIEPRPLWMRDRERNYWFEYLPDERLVYFQFNRVENEEEGESLKDFAARLFVFIAANDVQTLVIDVRTNHGGNNFLVKPIIDGVIRSERVNRRGALFVVTGRETFSACQNFVNRMERETNVLFVGEPTASRPNFVGEDNKILLPYSQVIVRGSSRYWQDSLSDDYRRWVAPDLVAEASSEDYRDGRDPALGVIREYLAHRASGASAAGAR